MGAVGRIYPNGDLDLALTIRTFAVAEGRIHLWVGGGIVWDSEPRGRDRGVAGQGAAAARGDRRAAVGAGAPVTLLAVAVAGRGLVDPEEPVVFADDEALLRGRAAFETLRVYGGRPFRLDEHLERMRGLGASGSASTGRAASRSSPPRRSRRPASRTRCCAST